MPERFVNEGFGWECRRCRDSESAGAAPRAAAEPDTAAATLARFFREGEAEGGGPRLSSASLARWKDATRRVLRCERCGAEEEFGGEAGGSGRNAP